MTIINIVILSGLIYGLAVRFRRGILQDFFFPGLVVKLVSGLFLGALYHFYYQDGDTIAYFQDAGELAGLAGDDLVEYFKALISSHHPALSGLQYSQMPRALFFVKIVSIFYMLTAGNYWLTSLYFSLLSFVGCWLLAKKLAEVFPKTHFASALAFLLLPSFVFWSGGVIKESAAIAALGICLYACLQCTEQPRIRHILIAILAWLLLWKLKYYYAGALAAVSFPTAIVIFINRKYKVAKKVITIVVWIGALVTAVLMIRLFHPNFYFSRIVEVVVENYYLYAGKTFSENLIHFYDLRQGLVSLLINAPWALFSGLFRPLIFEGGPWIKMLVGVENTILLLLAIDCLRRIHNCQLELHPEMIIAGLVYILVMATLLAFSVPNLGSLVRMRVGFLPFFWYLLLAISPWTGRIAEWVRSQKVKPRLPLLW